MIETLKPSHPTGMKSMLQLKPRTTAIGVVGAFLLIAVVCASTFSGSEEPEAKSNINGNDLKDLQRVNPHTGATITGRVTINQQFPLGLGFVVAYGPSRAKAIASSPLDKAGNYKLNDVFPSVIHLLIKRAITDKPTQAYLELTEGVEKEEEPIRLPGRGGPITPRSIGGWAGEHPVDPRTANKPMPSLDRIQRIRFDVSSSGFENLPEVRWMTDAAFKKYGQFNNLCRLDVPPGEGNRVFDIDLVVP